MSEIGEIPRELRYSKEHEWARLEDTEIVVGITDYAAKALGDVVFVELPKVGAILQSGKPFGVVESVKSVSDLFAPVSGVVTAINAALESSPEQVNDAPYADGWMIRLRPDNAHALEELLNADGYRNLLTTTAH